MLLLLAAVDEGLAAGFSGAESLDAIRAALGIPADFPPVGVIPVGHPLPDKRSPSLRRGRVPGEEFVRWEASQAPGYGWATNQTPPTPWPVTSPAFWSVA